MKTFAACTFSILLAERLTERYVTLRHLTEYMYVDSCTQSFIANEEESRGNVDAIHIGDWIACLGSKV